MRRYRHLLGTFRVGERQQASDLAWKQFEELVKNGELNKGKDQAYVEIRVYLIDHEKEER